MESRSGPNYRIEVGDDRLAIVSIHRRPDLDTSAGADEVERMAAALREAAAGTVDGLILDLTDAPPVTGPRTQATLASLLGDWVGTGRRAVLVVGPSAVQRLQIERLVADVGSAKLSVSPSLGAAVVWLRGAP